MNNIDTNQSQKQSWFIEFLFGKKCKNEDTHIKQIIYLEQAITELEAVNTGQREKIRGLENTIVKRGNENIELKAIILAERAEFEQLKEEILESKKMAARAKPRAKQNI
jgi:hypothetical protein